MNNVVLYAVRVNYFILIFFHAHAVGFKDCYVLNKNNV